MANTEKLICGIALVLAMSGCRDNRPDLTMGSKLAGMWKLDKYESFDTTSGKWFDTPKRIGYTGYILYDGMGHMGVQLIPPGFSDLDIPDNVDSLPKEDLLKVARFHVASFEYFADCKITDGGATIQHHRLSSNNPKDAGTVLTRGLEIHGDTLILTAKESIGGLKTRLRWVKRSRS